MCAVNRSALFEQVRIVCHRTLKCTQLRISGLAMAKRLLDQTAGVTSFAVARPSRGACKGVVSQRDLLGSSGGDRRRDRLYVCALFSPGSSTCCSSSA